MKRNRKTWLNVEQLDDRCCPSVTAGVVNGALVVIGQGASQLAITEPAANEFRVVDHGKQVGDYTNVTKGVRISLDAQADSVGINLGGHTLLGDLSIALGNGNNSLSIGNGTISGALNITGGKDLDTILLGGDGTAAPKSFPILNVTGNTSIDNGLTGNDALTLESGAILKGNLTVLSANTFTMEACSWVWGNANIFGGFASNTITVAGKVDQELHVSTANASDSLSLSKSAVVDSLFANLGDGNDQVDIAGSVAHALTLKTGGGTNSINLAGTVGGKATLDLGSGKNTFTLSGTVGSGGNGLALDLDGGLGKDQVTLAKGSFVNGSASLCLGAGSDTAVLAGTIGAVGSKATLKVNSGAGSDAVTFAGSLVINGTAAVNLGSGNDTFTLQKGAAFQSAVIDGDAGTDTFVGDRSQVKAVNFEK